VAHRHRCAHTSRRLTSTRSAETGVTWSPDSRRIAFSAQRENDEIAQIYTLDLAAGGEAQRLTNLSGGASGPKYSHNGRRLGFVSLMYPQARDDTANKKLIEAHSALKAKVRIFDGFPIRSWDHWLDERQVRIFVQELGENGLATASRAICWRALRSRPAPDLPDVRRTPVRCSSSISHPTMRPWCSPRRPIATPRLMLSRTRSCFS
jgi:dipeptidyl aminopeptidase/acylaminoacyl peptidase